ncbi:hypothetical protein Tco_1460640, partial [Tanacetum coccineum]
MSPRDRKKFRWGIAHANGCKGFTDPKTGICLKRISRKIRIPINLYPCRVEEKECPGKFPGYTPSKEALEKGPNYRVLPQQGVDL